MSDIVPGTFIQLGETSLQAQNAQKNRGTQ